jgi:hypothetical protein
MQTLILWMLAVYGITVGWTQIRRWLHHPQQKEAVHYYVYTHHSQGKIEWVIRSLSQLAKLEGREFHFYVIDSGSEDDTLKIINRFNRNGIQIKELNVIPEEINGYQDKMKIVIDLRERCYPCELRTT